MAVMEIRKAGDKILKELAVPVDKIDRKIRNLLNDMAETMYAADGVGLAAPQVGVSRRLVVIDVGDGLIELINPVIVAKEGCESGTEGCLSVPGMCGEVERYATVTVEAINRSGKKIQINGSGLLARALQHEIDHLDGILFIELAKTMRKG
ncbi:peptide deformylase [Sporomusa termitida]|uniref:Peptide deformylase n=1 Tax=Sporomusa termitida TaxID=2377 RepID=A0A517DTK4_9FIRM|nr:peptide deformylase [Sporomusa termitida]QDR80677.1 Peptide deformylase 1 [Sporomusa termitida]